LCEIIDLIIAWKHDYGMKLMGSYKHMITIQRLVEKDLLSEINIRSIGCFFKNYIKMTNLSDLYRSKRLVVSRKNFIDC
jgi:hypothetical protein